MYNFIQITDRKISLNNFQPTGRPILVMLRGLSRSYKGWLGLEEDLSEKYDVICLDLPGLGLSRNEKLLYSIEAIGLELAAVIKHLDLPGFFIMAPSLGSIVTYEIVQHFSPVKILGVIILVPSHTGFGTDRISGLAIKTLSTASFVSEEKKMELFTKMLIGRSVDGKDPFIDKPEFSEKWKNQLLGDTTELGTKGQLSQIFAAGKYTSKKGLDFIRKYQIPTKFIIADSDKMIPIAHKKKIYNYLKNKNSELIELQNSGHDFIVTHKKEVNDIVVDFIENIAKYKRGIGEYEPDIPQKYPKVINKIAVGVGVLALGAIATYLLKRRR